MAVVASVACVASVAVVASVACVASVTIVASVLWGARDAWKAHGFIRLVLMGCISSAFIKKGQSPRKREASKTLLCVL